MCCKVCAFTLATPLKSAWQALLIVQLTVSNGVTSWCDGVASQYVVSHENQDAMLRPIYAIHGIRQKQLVHEQLKKIQEFAGTGSWTLRWYASRLSLVHNKLFRFCCRYFERFGASFLTVRMALLDVFLYVDFWKDVPIILRPASRKTVRIMWAHLLLKVLGLLLCGNGRNMYERNMCERNMYERNIMRGRDVREWIVESFVEAFAAAVALFWNNWRLRNKLNLSTTGTLSTAFFSKHCSTIVPSFLSQKFSWPIPQQDIQQFSRQFFQQEPPEQSLNSYSLHISTNPSTSTWNNSVNTTTIDNFLNKSLHKSFFHNSVNTTIDKSLNKFIQNSHHKFLKYCSLSNLNRNSRKTLNW